MQIGDAPRILPHRYPFQLVDRVVEVEPGHRIVALKNISRNEPHFVGHFPERPIMPGVLICEALAQAGGLLVHACLHGSLTPEALTAPATFLVLTGLDAVKFRRPVMPGDQLRLEVSLLRRRRPLWRFRGEATVDGHLAAQAEFTAVEVDPDAIGGAETARPAGAEETPVTIHPTALIDPSAELDEGVIVDAYSVVGANARIGRESHIGPHAIVGARTTMGAANRIFPYASVGCVPQDLKYAGEESRLILGDRNSVREFATISIGTAGGGMETRIGDDNLFMNNSHVGHDCTIGSHVILANSVPLAGHVVIGDYAIVSGLAAVAQFVRIGESAFIGGGSMVVMDIPPFCIANGDRARLVGLNVIGLERRAVGDQEVKALKRCYRLLFQSKLRVAEAVEKVREELPDQPRCAQLAAFVSASERGVTRP